ncbi:hypothetical protein [Rubinisphaera margarita]|uniref:hypothetical protein n=1 Tax=Rubinisphaera margarita TaxID=2909586 RepID=UPI001EE98025|nr:hypothetical protein [Rubinisphaera margarita]MCG6157175.1 hypothetical protein [Rubinisphaera margarita]
MKKFVPFLLLGIVLNSGLQNELPAQFEEKTTPKKLIEWSAVEPDSRTVRRLAEQFEQTPFDGFVFRATTATGEQMMWQMWGGRKYEFSEFGHVIEDFKQTTFNRPMDYFVRANVTPGKVDWFDDDAWSIICHNFAVAARLARATGSVGLLFDTEQYAYRPFDTDEIEQDFPSDPDERKRQVKQRGREWIRAINSEFPEATILLTFAYRASQESEEERFRVGNYELLAPFLDGVLEACDERTQFIDGWEYAYGYRSREEFQRARRIMTKRAARWAADSDRYRKHFRPAFGIWTDYAIHDFTWNSEDWSANFHQPAEFEERVRLALEQTDEYVWVYSSEANWWTGKQLPEDYRRALKNAMKAKTAAAPE